MRVELKDPLQSQVLLKMLNYVIFNIIQLLVSPKGNPILLKVSAKDTCTWLLVLHTTTYCTRHINFKSVRVHIIHENKVNF